MKIQYNTTKVIIKVRTINIINIYLLFFKSNNDLFKMFAMQLILYCNKLSIKQIIKLQTHTKNKIHKKCKKKALDFCYLFLKYFY